MACFAASRRAVVITLPRTLASAGNVIAFCCVVSRTTPLASLKIGIYGAVSASRQQHSSPFVAVKKTGRTAWIRPDEKRSATPLEGVGGAQLEVEGRAGDDDVLRPRRIDIFFVQ